MVNLVRGAGTGVPLGDVTPLLLPWARDPWGALRPRVSVEAMRLSAELAAATYHTVSYTHLHITSVVQFGLDARH